LHHYHFHSLIPTRALRSLWFIRSLFQHYALKTRKTQSFKTLVKKQLWTIVKTPTCFGQLIVHHQGVWSVLDWNCRWFRYCISVVSVVLVVRLDLFGRVWHLSCVLFWLVYVLLMLFSGVCLACCSGWFMSCWCCLVECFSTPLNRCQALPNESNLSAQQKQPTCSNETNRQFQSRTLQTPWRWTYNCPKHVGVLTMVHRCF
jgi:hypothetical protein